jgi:hypothetical protein
MARMCLFFGIYADPKGTKVPPFPGYGTSRFNKLVLQSCGTDYAQVNPRGGGP